MHSSNELTKPIALFDSGLGGLTVLKALKVLMPSESFIYFGDTAHLPWGDKSAHTIQGFAGAITNWLIDKGCKCIVVACHTASSVALEVVEANAAPQLVFNVIDPTINYLAQSFVTPATIGLIGTKQTIRSNAYSHKFISLKLPLLLKAKATPLLVPLIEEGFSHRHEHILLTVLEEYLPPQLVNELQALILGCTHYPLIKPLLHKLYPELPLIDAAEVTALHVAQRLKELELLAPKNNNSYTKIYLSDLNDFFQEMAERFLQYPVKLEPGNLW